MIDIRKIGIFVIFSIFLWGCKQKNTVHTTFYFWKTNYKSNPTEAEYLNKFHSNSMYVRIMDVDFAPDSKQGIPISPIKFSNPLPPNIDIIPVIFIVNHIFENISDQDIKLLSDRIINFVDAKVKQAGKSNFREIQIDCDWTKTTRDRYFNFLKQLNNSPILKDKSISVTLRLHQVKNIVSSGIPPVKKAILMCYNMGNLRKYGMQNSILDQHELNIYLTDYLENYPLKLDVALPLFEWAVVFRNQEYFGISKRISKIQLKDKKLFKQRDNSILYDLLTDYPAAGLQRGDVVRWEEISTEDLLATSGFLSRYLKAEDRNIVFYHLDSNLLTHYTDEGLKKVIANF